MKIQINLELTEEELNAFEMDCMFKYNTDLGHIYRQITTQICYEKAVKDIGY